MLLKNFNITSLQLLLLLLLIRLKSDVYLEMALLLHCTIEKEMGRAWNILRPQNHFNWMCTFFFQVRYVRASKGVLREL